MRLRKIQSVLQTHTEELIPFTSMKSTNNTHTTISNYPVFMKAVKEIEKLNIFNSTIAKLDANELYLITEHQQLRFSVEKISRLNSIALELYHNCIGALNLINSVFDTTQENEDSLVVSLPNRNIDFKELEIIINELNVIFSLLAIHPEIRKEAPQLENLDVGSDWLVIAFYSAGALYFFGNFISVSLIAAQRVKSNKILDLELENISAEEETKRQYREALQKINLNVYEEYAKKLVENDEKIDSTPENLSQMAKAIAKANDLFSTGVAFESSINASNKIAESFPNLIEQQTKDYTKSLIELKRLSDNSSDLNE